MAALVNPVWSQLYTLYPLHSVNTSKDEIACTWIEDALVVSSNAFDVSSKTKNAKSAGFFSMEVYTKGENLKQFSTPYLLLGTSAAADEGTASYAAHDSILYFSSAVNYDSASGKKLKLYSSKWNGKEWSSPRLLPFCNPLYDFAHPYYDEERKLLVFSSNMPGGKGQMDIWFTYNIGNHQYTEAANFPFPVNTNMNETFPTVFNGDIYYASIRNGKDYDLFCAKENEQWEKSEPLPGDLNTEYNDLRIFFLNEENGYVSSTRPGSAGGSDIFFFHREKKKNQQHAFTAYLEYEGKALPGAMVQAFDELNEIALEETSNEQGKLPLGALNLKSKYLVRLVDVPAAKWSKCKLHIMDERGRIVRSFKFNANGELELELLAFDYSDLQLLPNPDFSNLTVEIEGQVYTQTPGDIGAGETITVIDDQGNLVAVAQTNQTGSFKLSKLFPELSYTFKLSDKSKATQVAITDNGKALVLPILKEEALYKTAAASEPIELVNESQETLFLQANEVHVINRIYYNHNSSELTADAKTQLNYLAELLMKNPQLKLQLEAHTDATGDESTNLKLSDLRANVALQYLASRGIARERMIAVAMGESHPVTMCTENNSCSDAQHAVNRRTELKLLLK
jgi:outer membrane protein OmpA-like peptidoglycan-associated protein